MDDPRLKWPFTMIVAGPSGCGKTTLVAELLANVSRVMDRTPTKVIVAFSQMQPLYGTFTEIAPCPVQLLEGLPPDLRPQPGTLLILDDLQGHDTKKVIRDWFTVRSHHYDTSVIYLVQNVFDKNAEHRTVSLNAHYMAIFKNPRDASQVTHLAKQMFPHNVKLIAEAYKAATEQPHSYLFLDLKQTTQDIARLRDGILPPSDVCKGYIFVDPDGLESETVSIQCYV